ncbi:MAG: SWF/SNF helicase family protein, partial [Ktedonobacterales bacterium]|nr:SWF/SNF helicase family protein [Ktedonobacterales bacterium]
RDDDVARLSGTWLQRRAPQLTQERLAVNEALKALDWDRHRIESTAAEGWGTSEAMPPDARWETLAQWLRDHLRTGDDWRADERAVIFTEYKDTLDYLAWRMRRVGMTDPAVLTIFGGAESAQREAIKAHFSDPVHPARVLLGTDAVSEGINLQATCRYVVHADIPWNPMRLEQRNGRVDRHGQARDVVCWHFTSEDEADLRFLSHVVGKIDTARRDLGSVGTVIDTTVLERFTTLEHTPDRGEVDRRVAAIAAAAPDVQDMRGLDAGGLTENLRARQQLAVTEEALELHPAALANLLAQAVALEGGSLTERSDAPQIYDLREPPAWRALVTESLRLPQTRAMPKLVFDPMFFQERIAGRVIFRPRADVALVRLGHPIMRRAVAVLRRRLWDDPDGQMTRWTVAGQSLPGQIETVVILHIFIEATNALRETLHQDVVALPFEVRGNVLVPLDARLWEQVRLRPATPLPAAQLHDAATHLRDLWPAHETRLGAELDRFRQGQAEELRSMAAQRLTEELRETRTLFAERRRALERMRDPREQQRREREQVTIARQQAHLLQPALFPDVEAELAAEAQALHLRQRELDQVALLDHLTQLGALVDAEEERTITTILPQRYHLAEHAPTALPLTVTYWVRA